MLGDLAAGLVWLLPWCAPCKVDGFAKLGTSPDRVCAVSYLNLNGAARSAPHDIVIKALTLTQTAICAVAYIQECLDLL